MVAVLRWLLCCVRWPSGFHEKDGKAYCRKDYFDMFAPKCGGCARAILENYISALNSLWHPECFVCRVSHSDLLAMHPEPYGYLLSWVLQPFSDFFFFFTGMFHAIRKREFLWSRRPALLRVALPRAARLPVLRLPEAHHRTLHHSHGQEVPPRTLCVRFLSQAAEQRHVQGAERKALLPDLFCQTLQLGCVFALVCLCVCVWLVFQCVRSSP